MKPIETTPAQLTTAFKWRTKGGEQNLAPSEMETHHLFYTLRMIWNHTVPVEHRFSHYNHYRLGPTYTPEYLLTAIHALLAELSLRRDITPSWMSDIKVMIEKSKLMLQPKLK